MPRQRRYSKTIPGGKPPKKPPSRSGGPSKAGRSGSGAFKTTGRPALSRSGGSQRPPAPPVYRPGSVMRPSLWSRLQGLFRRSPSSSRGGRSPAQAAPSGLSLDRKLDLVGVILVFVGLPTLLAIFSANRSAPSGNWLNLLSKLFGWGAYIFPLTLVLVGLWLILRNFERIPHIAVERVIGLGLLFVNWLVFFQVFIFPADQAASFAAA